jgi:hypothetical protein
MGSPAHCAYQRERYGNCHCGGSYFHFNQPAQRYAFGHCSISHRDLHIDIDPNFDPARGHSNTQRHGH